MQTSKQRTAALLFCRLRRISLLLSQQSRRFAAFPGASGRAPYRESTLRVPLLPCREHRGSANLESAYGMAISYKSNQILLPKKLYQIYILCIDLHVKRAILYPWQSREPCVKCRLYGELTVGRKDVFVSSKTLAVTLSHPTAR